MQSRIARPSLWQTSLRTFVHDESGATAIEYALIAAIGAIVIIGAVVNLGDSLTALYQVWSDAVNAAMGY
jgi:pilus assembly protein Flp/PilA